MKKILTLAIFALFALRLFAVPADPRPKKAVMEDGREVMITIHGDEFLNWTETADGRLVEKQTNGRYKFVSSSQFTKTTQGFKPTQSKLEQAVAKRETFAAARPEATTPISLGKRRFLILLVEFSDKAFTCAADPQAAFNNMVNQPGYSANGGVGSVLDWFNDQSHGRFEPTFDVLGPFKAPKTHSYYSADDTAYAPELLKAICQTYDSQIDFSQYDNDKDGYVDNVFMFYAGHNAAEGGTGIWPHAWSVSGCRCDGVYIDSYACTSEYNGNDSSKSMAGIGTYCHEFSHVIGLPDMYDTNYETNGEAEDTGYFDPMASGPYNKNGCAPPYMNAEELVMLGWMDGFDELNGNSGRYTLGPIHEAHGARVQTKTSGEYFFFEYRDGSGWDQYIINEPHGMLVYHVDKSNNRVSGNVTAKSTWSRNTINAYGSHPCFFFLLPRAYIRTKQYYYHYYSAWYPFCGISEVFNIPDSRSDAWKDYNGNEVQLHIKDMVDNGKSVTFDVLDSTVPDPLFYSGGYTSLVKTAYKAGEKLNTELHKTRLSVVSAEWFLDGAPASSATVMTAGEHTLKVKVKLSDGSRETLKRVITVE